MQLVTIIKFFGLVFAALLVLLVTLWGVLAIYYSGPAGLQITLVAAFGLCGLATVIALALPRWRRRASAGFVVVFAILIGWWHTLEPTNDRDWQEEDAVLAYAEIDGDLVTVHNIRNFDYRTETDFTPAYYDKTFNLSELQSVDLVAVYWMGPAIAHTFLSFGFKGGDYLAVSIETRDAKGQGYSTLKGFFKQYGLIYVVADERDVIRLRTNYRKDPIEDVYIYRVHRPIENGRRLFLEYLEKVNALVKKPAFYNTLIHNCTTTIWWNARVNPSHLRFSWKILLSGYAPEYLYEMGLLDTRYTFPELKQMSFVNKRAQAADNSPDFSRLIREVN